MKNVSAITSSTAASSQINISVLSNISYDNEQENQIKDDGELEQFDVVINPYYEKQQSEYMGSILMSRERYDDYLEIPPNEKNLLFDDAVEELKKNC